MAQYRVKIGCSAIGLPTAVVPVGWDSILRWERDSDTPNYVLNPKSDWLINCARLPATWESGDEGAAFQAMVDSETDCITYTCSVEQQCGETWTEVWSGEFSSRDWKRNTEKKTILIRPKKYSALDCIKNNWKEAQNIYAIAAWVTVKPYYSTYETKERVRKVDPDEPCGDPFTVANYCYYLTERTVDAQQDICIFYYHRYKMAGSCLGGAPVAPDTFTSWNILTNNCPTSSEWWACPPSARIAYTFQHGLMLKDVVEYLVTQTGCGLSVVSDFFGFSPDSTAPDNSAYTAAQAYCQSLVVFQKSDIKRHDASDLSRAPAWEMKLEDLLADLKAMFNVEWAIMPGNVMRIEHVSYFEAAAGNDYTAARYTREVEQDKNEAPRIIRFFYRDRQCYAYFKAGKVEIYCGVGDQEKQLALFSCDIEFIISDDGLESIGDDGFVLMSTLDGGGGNLYNVNNNRGLSWSELLTNFHTWNMAGAGEINGVEVTPNSVKKTRKQPPFSVPHCCDATFYPGETQTTALGAGQVISAYWNIAKDTLQLELKY